MIQQFERILYHGALTHLSVEARSPLQHLHKIYYGKRHFEIIAAAAIAIWLKVNQQDSSIHSIRQRCFPFVVNRFETKFSFVRETI